MLMEKELWFLLMLYKLLRSIVKVMDENKLRIVTRDYSKTIEQL